MILEKPDIWKGNINQLLGKAINVTDGIQRHLDAYLINQKSNSDKINMGCVSYQYHFSCGIILF